MTDPPPLPPALLPDGVRARRVDGVNGLSMHILEAGFDAERPTLLLLHGFPEIAYSWRKIIPALADAGFHVVAPDQRGYGRTTGWDANYDGDLASFTMFNLVADNLALLEALRVPSVAAVIGHDFGASAAAWCALLRPDVFHSLVLMSAPFAGPPTLTPAASMPDPIHAALAALDRPREHYQWYYSKREANENMWHCPQGVAAFLRAYFHYKSADWPGNKPFPLASWSAGELAKLPTYYIMDAGRGMAETARTEMPSARQIAACRWLTEAEARVYADEYERTGFQGGLQWYRCRTEGIGLQAMRAFAGKHIDVPSLFIAGASDWGVYQSPGSLERMRNTCADLRGTHLIEGAGHWVQQEQPSVVIRLLLEFFGAMYPERYDDGTTSLASSIHDTQQDPSMTTSAQTQADLDVLHTLNHDYINSVQHGNVRRFDELLAEEFYCSNPDGTLVNRPGFLAQTAKPVTISNLQAHDVLIRLYGDVAIIHARTTFTLPGGGHGAGRYTDVWACRDGIWRCVSAHVTRL